MSEAVLVALISLAGIIITAVMQYASTRKKISEEFAKQTAEMQRQSDVADLKLQAKLENFQSVTNEKIDELARRVEKHNQVVERTYKLEQSSAVLSEKMTRTDARLKELERGAAAN